MEDSVRRNAHLAVSQIDVWLIAAIETGMELCELHAFISKPKFYPRSNVTLTELRGRHLPMTRFTYKIAFFLSALNKVCRWGREAKKLNVELAEVIDRFIATCEAGKFLRDVHEHNDEYLLGKGRKQAEFQYDLNDMINTNATNTHVSEDGKIYIGGKVCVQEMIDAAESLRQSLSPLAPAPPLGAAAAKWFS
ncbi:hypothetical protein [Massilia varians]|uniref:hypothetical protein n=1 Tax=Massilia varians TaxID=457921 RepID=UPI0025551475|nr:hypothetical protein [Massilia varians]MDK6077899.1 hypothetical protein [Massilia varians]